VVGGRSNFQPLLIAFSLHEYTTNKRTCEPLAVAMHVRTVRTPPLLQVPVATDAPPVANLDTFIAPLDSQAMLPVLDNDTAAFGSLVLTAATSSNFGVVVICPDKTCLQYTPKLRFSGWDSLTYTAQDGRGRNAAASAMVRIETSAPRLLGLSQSLSLTEGSVYLPFVALQVSYDDVHWELRADVTLELDVYSGDAAAWPAGTLSLGGGSVGGLSEISVVATGDHTIGTVLAGNVSAVTTLVQRLAVATLPRYSGVGVLRLDVCSEWGECVVRSR
jgi:hypothetical protein